MESMDQESFLSRVRSSLGKSRHVSDRFPDAPSYGSSSDLIDRLACELEAVGGVVHLAGSVAEARRHILRILAEHESRCVVRADTPLMTELELDEVLENAGLEVTVCNFEGGERVREAEFVADAGISSADYGVAETGTLALLARPGQGRAVSLLPPLHIAVLRTSRIVLELGALFETVTAETGELPSALSFITGPSRTADIELVLTVGVHGPRELHLILLG